MNNLRLQNYEPGKQELLNFLEKLKFENNDQYVYAQSDHLNRHYYKGIYDYCLTDDEKEPECEVNCFCNEEHEIECKQKESKKRAPKYMKCKEKYLGEYPRDLYDDSGSDSDGEQSRMITYLGHKDYTGEVYRYKYYISALKKISENKYVYVVNRTNEDMTQDPEDVCYQLKLYNEGEITVDWIIALYNPYKGLSVEVLDYDEKEKVVTMHYSYCEVKLKEDSVNSKDFLHVGNKVGKVIEFKKG